MYQHHKLLYFYSKVPETYFKKREQNFCHTHCMDWNDSLQISFPYCGIQGVDNGTVSGLNILAAMKTQGYVLMDSQSSYFRAFCS